MDQVRGYNAVMESEIQRRLRDPSWKPGAGRTVTRFLPTVTGTK
jgi:hypothetical protein